VASGLQARDFISAAAAEEYCAEMQARNLHIFYIFDDPSRNFGEPLNCGG
jgi:hypothetical protein